MGQRFNDSADVDDRRIADLAFRATGGAPAVPPTTEDQGGDCRRYAQVTFWITNDDATKAGLCDVTPWLRIPVEEDPLGGALTYFWLPLDMVQIDMTAIGSDRRIDINCEMGDRLFVQLDPAAAGLAWVRADGFVRHERAEAQVVSS